MTKYLFTLLSFIIPSVCKSQQHSTVRLYERIGLANSDELIDCFFKGFPFIFIGLAIILYSILTEKETKKKESWSGCISIILIIIGVIIMFPILAWIEYLIVSIIGMGIILGIVYLILSSLKNHFVK